MAPPKRIAGLDVVECTEDSVLLCTRMERPSALNLPGVTRLIEVKRDGSVVAGDYPDVVATVVPVSLPEARQSALVAACFGPEARS